MKTWTSDCVADGGGGSGSGSDSARGRFPTTVSMIYHGIGVM